MEKFSNTLIYICPKCKWDGGLKGHHLSYLEERKEPSRYDGGPHPEQLLQTCSRCDAPIGRYKCLDSEDANGQEV